MKVVLKELAPRTFVTYKGKRWMLVEKDDGHAVLQDREGERVRVKGETKVNL